tara:strand:+ start:530 stop:1582 length:1053 start_codon:yes stop_codon:yes gene_type:complete
MNINFLVGNLDYFNSYAFIYPVYNSINELSKKNKIKISYDLDKNIYDLIFLDSKFFYKSFIKSDYISIQKTLDNIRSKCKILVYCDNEASLFINNKIYRYVDFYLKSKLPINKNYYSLKYYGLRSYTDFYNHKFNIIDKNERFSDILTEDQSKKNILGWNNGICDYSLYGNLKRKIFSITKLNFILKFNITLQNKTNKLSARINQSYSRETINFQRKYLTKILRDYTETNRVNKKQYFNEIAKSYSSLSPFGWGEVCYRDFEIFLNKSMLIKPTMEHLITWPNYYVNNKTYLNFEWDFNNFEKIISAVDDLDYCSYIADNGHQHFMSFFNDEGRKKFSNYFDNILNKVVI